MIGVIEGFPRYLISSEGLIVNKKGEFLKHFIRGSRGGFLSISSTLRKRETVK
jgi:hypothetical protein